MPEVLSPAGSLASLEAAIRAGADAVYFGLGGFNARKNAENIDDGALVGAVASCHIQGVKAYLTLNTLVREDELPAALHTAELAAAAGMDGLIVQDIGLASLLRRAAPGLPLHASTQMAVHTPAALPLLKEMGFCRVVAAREMSRDELAAFCRAARELDMEVEVFVHGALCMCVSGQCYMSAMLGGRSGNRGLCAQPCRLPFRVEGGSGFDLSLKDMSLVDHIAQLGKMGVASLKIEGRMKRPEYVAAATAVCRMAADGQRPPDSLRRQLEQVFSRSGFTDGYFTGQTGPAMFGRRTESDQQRSADVLAGLHELTRQPRQSVPVKGLFTLEAGRPSRFSLTDGQLLGEAEGPVPEPARSRPLDAVRASAQLSKLGGTCFTMEDLTCRIEEGYTLPASALNALRRQAAGELAALRGKTRPIPFSMPVRPAETPSAVSPPGEGVLSPAGKGNPGRVAWFSHPGQLPENLASYGLAALCLPVETDFASLSLPAGLPVWAHLPRGLFGRDDWALEKLAAARAAGVHTALCGNLSAAALARRAGMQAVWDFSMNLFNPPALEQAADLGAAGAVLSAELTLQDGASLLRSAHSVPWGLFAYGRLPLMLTRNCPGRNRGPSACKTCGGECTLTDRKHVDFPVRCRAGCSEIYNSRPLWMADRLGEIRDFDFLLLYFTLEDAETCAAVLAAYRDGGPPPAAFTRGLLYRGVE